MKKLVSKLYMLDKSELVHKDNKVSTTKSTFLRLEIRDSILAEVVNFVFFVTDNRVHNTLTHIIFFSLLCFLPSSIHLNLFLDFL